MVMDHHPQAEIASDLADTRASSPEALAHATTAGDHSHHVLLDWRLVLVYLGLGIAALLLL